MALDKVYWSFSKKKYATMTDFDKDISAYNNKLAESLERENYWHPEEILINEKEIQIEYMAWVDGPKQLLENERLSPVDEDAFEDEDDEYQVEIISKLEADNGKYFTALEFMFKAHNQQANKELGDHVFFEGIDDEGQLDEKNNIKTWYIGLGS